jgi:hypothetical protein
LGYGIAGGALVCKSAARAGNPSNAAFTAIPARILFMVGRSGWAHEVSQRAFLLFCVGIKKRLNHHILNMLQ